MYRERERERDRQTDRQTDANRCTHGAADHAPCHTSRGPVLSPPRSALSGTASASCPTCCSAATCSPRCRPSCGTRAGTPTPGTHGQHLTQVGPGSRPWWEGLSEGLRVQCQVRISLPYRSPLPRSPAEPSGGVRVVAEKVSWMQILPLGGPRRGLEGEPR